MRQHLDGLPHVFLSVDIDVCDPAFAPGTGTPEPGGLHARELLRAVRRIASSVPLAGIEVVEVSPPFDPAGITALLAHRIVLEVLVRDGPPAVGRTGPAGAPIDRSGGARRGCLG